MGPRGRTTMAILLAGVGTLATYLGSLINAAALGGTLGDVAIVPGLVLLAVSTLPLANLPRRGAKYWIVTFLRYASLPIFLLAAVLLAQSLPHIVSAKADVQGAGPAVLTTIGGFVAIMWPEALLLWRRRGSADA